MQEPLGAFRVKAAAKAVSRALRSRGRGALDALGHEARLSHSAPVRPSKYGPPEPPRVLRRLGYVSPTSMVGAS
jgi:hypothetical protein